MTADIVSSVSKCNELVGRTHGPFYENVLRSSASGSDSINTSLVKVGNKSVRRFIVKFVIAIEDDIVVGSKLGSEVGPEGFKIRRRSKNGAVVSAKVLGVKHSVSSSFRDVVDDSGHTCEVVGVKTGGHGSRSHTLHEERKAEDVHALVHKGLD